MVASPGPGCGPDPVLSHRTTCAHHFCPSASPRCCRYDVLQIQKIEELIGLKMTEFPVNEKEIGILFPRVDDADKEAAQVLSWWCAGPHVRCQGIGRRTPQF